MTLRPPLGDAPVVARSRSFAPKAGTGPTTANMPVMRIRWTALAVAVVASVGPIAGGPARAAGPLGDYEDQAYARHDVDNVSRSTWRHTHLFTSPDYEAAMVPVAADTWLQGQGTQLEGLRSGRAYVGAGNILVGGSVGDPRVQNLFPDGVATTGVQFLSRTGAKLSGHVWWNARATHAAPGIVITTGSIQGHEHMYWWAAKALAAKGFSVFTWDVQGQGQSDGLGHAPGSSVPTTDGVPAQQNANFDQGTVDALEFFLSTPKAPYAPPGYDAAAVSRAKAAAAANDEHIDWVNPLSNKLDHTRLGLAGHSLGAFAVSEVQQCSDRSTVWSKLPICDGRSFPIRAVVGWDALSAPANANGVPFTPAVPGLNLQADGYFMNPVPSSTAPDPASHLAAHKVWTAAGLDTYSATIRGGIHNEFIQVPYVALGTRYGTDLAEYYTVAWLSRYVAGDRASTAALLAGPRDNTAYTSSPLLWPTAIGADYGTGPSNPWNAHHLSARYLSAFSIHDGIGRRARLVQATDLRAAAGLSRVGDWPGANADSVDSVFPAP